MKSNKQRRQELKARRKLRAERQARRLTARPVDRPVGVVPVDPVRLRPTPSYGLPDFVQRGYYQDQPLLKTCENLTGLSTSSTTVPSSIPVFSASSVGINVQP